jgi:restriction system protein
VWHGSILASKLRSLQRTQGGSLFQRDAAAVGAERAVLVSLGRISEPARRAATQATPNVELIDGERLVELCAEQEIGLVIQPHVDREWFRRFE